MPVGSTAWVFGTEGTVTAAAAGTAKTVLMVRAASNRAFAVTEICIGFEGASGTAKPVLVELVEWDGSGAGAGSSSVTARKSNNGDSSTVQSTGTKGYTTEPTTLVATGREWMVHPQVGQLIQLPLGREPRSAINHGLGLRVTFLTAETTTPIHAYMEIEE